MLQPWQDAVVTKIVQETPTTKRFFFALTSGQKRPQQNVSFLP